MLLAASARPAGYTVETVTLQGKVGELTTHGMPCNMHLYVADAVGMHGDLQDCNCSYYPLPL